MAALSPGKNRGFGFFFNTFSKSRLSLSLASQRQGPAEDLSLPFLELDRVLASDTATDLSENICASVSFIKYADFACPSNKSFSFGPLRA